MLNLEVANKFFEALIYIQRLRYCFLEDYFLIGQKFYDRMKKYLVIQCMIVDLYVDVNNYLHQPICV